MHIVDIRGISTQQGLSLGMLARANRANAKIQQALKDESIFAVCCDLSQLKSEEIEALLQLDTELISSHQLESLYLELTTNCVPVTSTRSRLRHKTTASVQISEQAFCQGSAGGMAFLTMPEHQHGSNHVAFLVLSRREDCPKLTADDLYYFSNFASISW